jgi:hypothetical protein
MSGLLDAPRGFADDIRDLGERSGPGAVSPKGATGVMQVMPGTALNPGFGLRPSDGSPGDTERLGREYAAKLEDYYQGNRTLASAAYNAGPGRVNQWLRQYGDPRTGQISLADWTGKIPFTETRDYVQRVAPPGRQANVLGTGPRTDPGPVAAPNLLDLLKAQPPAAKLGLFDPQVLAMKALAALVPGTHRLQAVDYDPYGKGMPGGGR